MTPHPLTTSKAQLRVHSPCASGWLSFLRVLGPCPDGQSISLSTIIDLVPFDDALWATQTLDYPLLWRKYLLDCIQPYEGLISTLPFAGIYEQLKARVHRNKISVSADEFYYLCGLSEQIDSDRKGLNTSRWSPEQYTGIALTELIDYILSSYETSNRSGIVVHILDLCGRISAALNHSNAAYYAMRNWQRDRLRFLCEQGYWTPVTEPFKFIGE